MKIRDKLFLGFGLYIVLSAVLGLIAYRELRTIKRGLALVQTADDVTNTLLEVRRYEKNFLLYKDAESRRELDKYLAGLKTAIDNIEAEIIAQIGTENHDMMQRSLAAYERGIHTITRNVDAQRELEVIVRKRGRQVEQQLAPERHEAFLNLRRHEKNIMLERSTEAFGRFGDALTGSELVALSSVSDYAGLVGKLFELYRSERASEENMRQAAREMQAFTESLAHEERGNIARTLKTAAILLFVGLGLIIVIGIVINHKLAESIVRPIQDLERVTKKVSRGDFSEAIEVKGSDEIASLAQAYNRMEQKLDQAMTALDEIIKQLQEKQSQLVEAEKLASIGKLAAGIAHEINNPLTSVLTFSNLMLESCPPDDPRHNRLKMMVKETERARTIIRQLLNFGRESVLKPEKIDINQPVTEIADSLVAQEAFKGIELRRELATDLPIVHADPAQLGQVVLNLLLNAIHAITPPGTITIATRKNGSFIEILFRDTGKGIAPDHLNRIFDPFFTTKHASKGTGLGLAVSYGIIQKHGGEITVESEVGKGTAFTVRMPVYG
jgi:signal transduction histidine kinase